VPRLGRVRSRSRLRRPRAAAGGGGGAYELLQLADLTYEGANKVESTPNGIDIRYSRSLAFKDTPSDTTEPKHLVSMGANAGPYAYGVYEMRVGSPTIRHTIPDYDPRNYTACGGVKDYKRLPYTTAGGVDLAIDNELSGCSGGDWDHWTSEYIWALSVGYGNWGFFGKATLDYANATAVGTGIFQCSDPLWKGTSAGGIVAPSQEFADDFFGGKLRGLCAGTSESIVNQGDQSFGTGISLIDALPAGFDIYPKDCATASAGATTVTSVTGGFTAGMVGHYFAVPGSNGPWFEPGYYLINSVTDTNTIVLATSPTPQNAGSAGACYALRRVTATHAVGYWPYTEDEQAGAGRMNRPESSTAGGNRPDSWAVDKWGWGDHHRKPTIVDTVVDRAGTPTRVVAVVVIFDYYRGYTQYLTSQIPGSYPGMGLAFFDPADFATATGSTNARYEVQPYYITPPDWLPPVCDPDDYARPSPQTVTSVASSGAGQLNDWDGCVVTCTGHGKTAGGNVEITGAATSQHNGLWNISGGSNTNGATTGAGAVIVHCPGGVGIMGWMDPTMVGLDFIVSSGPNAVAGTYTITDWIDETHVELDSSPTPAGAGSDIAFTVSGIIDANSFYIRNSSSVTAWAGATDNNVGIEMRELLPAPDTPFGCAADNDAGKLYLAVIKSWGVTGLDTRPLFLRYAVG
jgi:hypothetical protein